MSYTAWSVVFGEQPTAAKWNQLGQNDAGFKDGTNIDNLAILTRHLADSNVTSAKLAQAFVKGRYQANTTNSTIADKAVQMGFNYVPIVASTNGSRSVTFPTAFSEVPILLPCILSYNPSVPASAGDLGGALGVGPRISISSLTATGFTAQVYQPSSSTTNFVYHWIAIGAL